MKKTATTFVCGAVCTAALFLFAAQVHSQEKAAPAAQEDQMTEMMEKWREINALGPEHEKFKGMVGKWSFVSKMWMAPGAPPTESTGEAEFKLILDGRFIQQDYRCEFMGAPYIGLGIEGFDRIKNKYVSIWMDNCGTSIFVSEGTMDKTGKICTYHGKMDDPISGQKDKPCRMVATDLDDDRCFFEMFETQPDGVEMKTMEISYKRKK